jgi:glycerophosphoryl diester phosphodiesterase
MIEFDVRLTRDKVPVLSHNLHLYGTRKRELAILRRYTLAQLQERTSTSEHPITTLDDAMKQCFGRIYLNIELKEVSAVIPTLAVISKYAKKKSDWDSLLLSSFKPLALRAIRKRVPHVALGMLHHRNPLAFVGWHKVLQLSAVGFNRLYVSPISLEIAKQLGLFTYAYTVNRKEAAQMLIDKGIDGIVTDYPARMQADFDNPS